MDAHYVAQDLACGKLSASIVIMILPGYVLAKLLAPEVPPSFMIISTLPCVPFQCNALPSLPIPKPKMMCSTWYSLITHRERTRFQWSEGLTTVIKCPEISG